MPAGIGYPEEDEGMPPMGQDQELPPLPMGTGELYQRKLYDLPLGGTEGTYENPVADSEEYSDQDLAGLEGEAPLGAEGSLDGDMPGGMPGDMESMAPPTGDAQTADVMQDILLRKAQERFARSKQFQTKAAEMNKRAGGQLPKQGMSMPPQGGGQPPPMY